MSLRSEKYDVNNEKHNSDNEKEFIFVSKKKSSRKPSNITKNKKLELNNVTERCKNILEVYKPYAAYLYGSTARRKNRYDSDVDVFVIWKNRIPQKETIDLLHDELRNEFERRIDLVNYQYNGKIIKVRSQDSCFIQNIICDAVSIIEPHEKYKIIDDILFDYDCYHE